MRNPPPTVEEWTSPAWFKQGQLIMDYYIMHYPGTFSDLKHSRLKQQIIKNSHKLSWFYLKNNHQRSSCESQIEIMSD